MPGIFPQSGVAYFLSAVPVFLFKYPQLFIGQAHSNKTSDPDNQAQVIPNSKFVCILYKDQKGRGKENDPKGLYLKKDKKSKVRIFTKIFTQICIAGIFRFTPASA